METDPDRIVSEFLVSLPGGIAGRRVLVAVSGGADSVALLELLSLHSERLGFDIAAVTVQHGLRTDGSSEADARFVQELCEAHTPRIACFRVDFAPGDVSREALKRGGGIEDAARALRYRAFVDRADSWGAHWIMTGHNRNDRLETILMRFFQGASGSSLAGIQPLRDRFARPLLVITRDTLVSWLSARGIAWREDPTNGDVAFLRNGVRSRLVPLLGEIFPGWDASVLSGSARAALDDEYIAGFADFAWEPIAGGIRATRSTFDSLHPALAHRALKRALEILAPGRRIPHGYLDRILSDRGNGLSCGAGLRFERSADFVFWGPDIVHYDKSGYLVTIDAPGIHDTAFGRVTVTLNGEAAFLDGDFGPWKLPLSLRSRLPGDGGAAELKKTFNEWGVPETLRDRIPLVEQDGSVRAVFGRPFGYPDRFI